MILCVCILFVSVPLSPDGVSCGQLTSSSIIIDISRPNVSSSSYHIDLYEVTYKSVIESFPEVVTHNVAFVDKVVVDDALTNATSGVTYSVTVVSRAGHLTSQSVLTTCTAGQSCCVLCKA